MQVKWPKKHYIFNASYVAVGHVTVVCVGRLAMAMAFHCLDSMLNISTEICY